MIDRIKSIVDRTAGKIAHLECDGATRVLNYLLTKEGIPHQVMRGRAAIGVESITHYWISQKIAKQNTPAILSRLQHQKRYTVY